MLYAWLLFAQQQGDKAGGKGGAPDYFMFLPFVIIAVLFYLLIVVPGRKERQQRVQLLGALKKNDEVVTSAGIIGVVSAIKEKEDEVTLKIDDNARLRVLKSSIVRILTKEAPKEG